MARNQPIGIELVKLGIVTEKDINTALDYQRKNPSKKIGEILYELNLCDAQNLINAIGQIIGEKAMILTPNSIRINVNDYMSIDIAKRNKAVPFDIEAGKVKVCFAETTNKRNIEAIRLLFLNKGLVMEKYITFGKCIDDTLASLRGENVESIDVNADILELVDSIIRNAIEKRASDIHIEPEEDSIRVRYRIDGNLFTAATIEKEKQAQLIGRLKAISNMHQEKQESQDGRIITYPDYNIRVSSQKNVNGEKFVLRLLKKNSDVQQIFELGFPNDPALVKKAFDKRNSIVLVAAPTGEGKTTTLYSILDFLDKPEINITTIEDPVEIRMPGLNQIEIDSKTSFSDSLRTILRQDPDIILVGEIRDKETAEIAIQAGQTGHYVLSTIHTIDSVEVITRLRKIGVSDYDISSTLATSLSQRLVRRVCPHCAQKRPFTDEEKQIMTSIAKKYNEELNFDNKFTYTTTGCAKCNNSGFFGRIGIFEILNMTDTIKELVIKDASTIEIRNTAIQEGYRPLVIDGLKKVLDGYTTLEELNRKLIIY